MSDPKEKGYVACLQSLERQAKANFEHKFLEQHAKGGLDEEIRRRDAIAAVKHDIAMNILEVSEAGWCRPPVSTPAAVEYFQGVARTRYTIANLADERARKATEACEHELRATGASAADLERQCAVPAFLESLADIGRIAPRGGKEEHWFPAVKPPDINTQGELHACLLNANNLKDDSMKQSCADDFECSVAVGAQFRTGVADCYRRFKPGLSATERGAIDELDAQGQTMLMALQQAEPGIGVYMDLHRTRRLDKPFEVVSPPSDQVFSRTKVDCVRACDDKRTFDCDSLACEQDNRACLKGCRWAPYVAT